jgi:Protein of unknown function (DUF2750)
MEEPYELNDHEFAAVSALDGRKRFEHLLKRICDTELVYVLADSEDDLVVLDDDEADAPSQLPIWPHPRYVQAYRASWGGGAECSHVELTPLIEELLPELAEAGVEIVVMPTDVQRSVPALRADELRKAILSYHDEWYGGWPKYARLP